MFDFTEEELKAALGNPDAFSQMIKDINDIDDAVKQFPALADALILCITSDVVQFKRLITSQDAFKKFSQIARSLSNPNAFNNEWGNRFRREMHEKKSKAELDSYNRLVKNRTKLAKAGLPFPDHTQAIANLLCADVELFLRLMSTNKLVWCLRFESQQYKNLVIALILSNEAVYKRIIECATTIDIFHIVNIYPHHADLFSNPVLFDQLRFDIKNQRNHILEYFMLIIGQLINPEGALKLAVEKRLASGGNTIPFIFSEQSLETMAEDRKTIDSVLPNYAGILAERILASKHYQELMSSAKPLLSVATLFRDSFDTKQLLFPLLFSSPAEFKRLVSSKKKVQKLATLYPKISIFRSETPDEVNEKIEEYTNARDNASLIGQGGRCAAAFFHRLDPTTLAKISCHTVNQTITDPKVLNAVVNKALNKPIMLKI